VVDRFWRRLGAMESSTCCLISLLVGIYRWRPAISGNEMFDHPTSTLVQPHFPRGSCTEPAISTVHAPLACGSLRICELSVALREALSAYYSSRSSRKLIVCAYANSAVPIPTYPSRSGYDN